ncbi:unnamed protein product [Protopolystoma xenopodis]|uniref:Uncharacterized protein n=1 Tax=Protopolystoma xenopodis TaxID=117903 RepID=A0A3S5A1Q8_9PLAT|nr:unnamed protein product [Protopolystoma xenopodis]
MPAKRLVMYHVHGPTLEMMMHTMDSGKVNIFIILASNDGQFLVLLQPDSPNLCTDSSIYASSPAAPFVPAAASSSRPGSFACGAPTPFSPASSIPTCTSSRPTDSQSIANFASAVPTTSESRKTSAIGSNKIIPTSVSSVEGSSSSVLTTTAIEIVARLRLEEKGEAASYLM